MQTVFNETCYIQFVKAIEYVSHRISVWYAFNTKYINVKHI